MPAAGKVAGLKMSGGEIVLPRLFVCLLLCSLRLEEPEVVGWKELEVPGGEYGLPEKLHVPVFHLKELAFRLGHYGGRGLSQIQGEDSSAKRRRHMEPHHQFHERRGGVLPHHRAPHRHTLPGSVHVGVFWGEFKSLLILAPIFFNPRSKQSQQ